MKIEVPETIVGTLVQIRSRNLLWRHLRALNELYEKRRAGAQALENKYIKHLQEDKRIITFKPDNKDVLVPVKSKYNDYYETSHKENFARYNSLLEKSGLPADGKRQYTEFDLLGLMLIQHDKATMQKSLTTARTFSGKVFGESKYLENHKSVLSAVCHLLEIESFPADDPKDFQWRSVVDCRDANVVVLCENLDFLKLPWQARKHQVELWYVGGNNISIIDHIGPEKLSLPLYYSGDWDYDGLKIFLRIRQKLLAQSKTIRILMPHNTLSPAPVDSPTHFSKWVGGLPFSNFDANDFDEEQQALIKRLIKDDLWIEEETQDLVALLNANGVL